MNRRCFTHLLLPLAIAATSSWGSSGYLRAQEGSRYIDARLFERISHPVLNVQLDDSVLEYLGQWGSGFCYGVATMGNYVLTGTGPRILWIDYADKHRPVVAWETLSTPRALVWAFTIQDSIGYVLDGAGLVVLDLRSPRSPSIVGRLGFGVFPRSFAVEGPFVFVQAGAVFCVDVSNPRVPFVRSVASSATYWGPMTISQNRLYVCDRSGEYAEYMDVSNPDSITMTRLYGLPRDISSSYARDSILLVGHRNQLMIYSITAPASPVLLSNTLMPDDEVCSIALRGDTAFVGTKLRKIVTVDIADRRLPVIRGIYSPAFPPNRYGLNSAIQDTVLYCAYPDGLAAFSVANAGSVTPLSFFPTGDESNRTYVRNGLAYVTSGYAGIWVVDVTEPSHPHSLANFRFPGFANDLLIDSTIAYMSVGDPQSWTEELWNGVVTIDISRSDSLTILDSIRIANAFSISKSGSLLFVTQVDAHGIGFDTLTVLDVSDPSNIRVAGQIGQGAGKHNSDVCARDSIAFLASNGLEIIDCRDPGYPRQLSSILPSAFGVSLNGNLAYVLSRPDALFGRDTFFVIDVSNPSAPFVLGRVRRPGNAPVWGLTVESAVGKNVVFWAGSGELGACDVTNPSQPAVVFQSSYSDPCGVHAVGDTVFMTDRYTGLWIFRYRPGTAFAEPGRGSLVEEARLLQNYPNPFNATTQVEFSVPTRQRVRIEVFNLLGQHATTLFDGIAERGEHKVQFNGTSLPSGVYFYRLFSDNSYKVGRAVLLR